jgi:sodium transport system permease protein
MKPKRSMLGVVYRKELIDSLRDRRALISMIVVPLVVMPLLMIGLGGLGVKLAERARVEVLTAMVIGGEHAPELVAAIEKIETIRLTPASSDFRQQIADKEVQVVLRVPEDFAGRLETLEPAELTIFTYEGEARSAMAAARLESFLRGLRARVVQERLEAEGLPGTLVEPFAVRRENVAPPERVTGALIGGLLPYVLIMMCIAGAIYPAMDLTAGEKERGTMETLLSSPVSRLTLVLGKFLVVFTFSVATAFFALSALGGTFWLAVYGLQATGALVELAISPLAIAGFFLLLLPMAALFSALLLAISLFARTFREAQTYVSPLMIVALLPAAIALMPGVEFTLPLAFVPVLNISLIGRDILSGLYDWVAIGTILVSSSLYAGLALWAAVRLFQQEAVVFRE